MFYIAVTAAYLKIYKHYTSQTVHYKDKNWCLYLHHLWLPCEGQMVMYIELQVGIYANSKVYFFILQNFSCTSLNLCKLLHD